MSITRMSSPQQFSFFMEGLEPPPWPNMTRPPMREWPTFPLHTPAMPTPFPSFTQSLSIPSAPHATTGASQPTPMLASSASPHSNVLPNRVPPMNHGPSTSSAPTSGRGPSISTQSNAFSSQEGSAELRCDSGISEMVAPLLTSPKEWKSFSDPFRHHKRWPKKP